MDGRRADEHKIGHRARDREQQHEADDRGEPFVPLFPLPLLHAGLDRDVVILVIGLERVVIALRVAVHLAVDALDHVVEHLRVRREVFLEVVGHRLAVRELHRLDLVLGVWVDRFELAGDRRDNQCVVRLVAFHVLDQGLLHLVRVLIAILRLERARLVDDLRHLIVGVHRRGQILARDAELVRRLGRRALIFKRRVVAVIDAVEDQAHGVDVRRRLDRSDEAEQLRRGLR